MFDVEAATGDGDVDMRVLIELPAVGVQCAKDADVDTLPTGTAEQAVEQEPAVVMLEQQLCGAWSEYRGW